MNKETSIKLFEEKQVRSVWNEEESKNWDDRWIINLWSVHRYPNISNKHSRGLCTELGGDFSTPQHGFPDLSGAGRLVLKDLIMLGAGLICASDSAKRIIKTQ